jgi:hypothetical protein
MPEMGVVEERLLYRFVAAHIFLKPIWTRTLSEVGFAHELHD